MVHFTHHAIKRIRQRGISDEMVYLVLEFGEYVKDKVILNSKKLNQLIKRTNEVDLKSKILKILDKGGLVVVLSEDDILITAYNCNK